MKSLLRGATALAGIALAGSAFAADLPRRAEPPPMAPAPVFTWTGFYAGFSVGYGASAIDYDNSATTIAIPASSGLLVNAAGAATAGNLTFGGRDGHNGFVGGGGAGYNYQLTPGTGAVIGIEADASYVDFGRDRNNFATSAGTGPAAGVTFFNPKGISNLDYYGTVRGRLGYAFDRTLVYGTGGFAFGSGGGHDDIGLTHSSRDDFRTGWVAGAGVEYALPTDSFINFFRSSAVTFKVEGQYVSLNHGDRSDGAFGTSGGVPVTLANSGSTLVSGTYGRRNNDTEFVVFRTGLNYKFGSY